MKWWYGTPPKPIFVRVESAVIEPVSIPSKTDLAGTTRIIAYVLSSGCLLAQLNGWHHYTLRLATFLPGSHVVRRGVSKVLASSWSILVFV